MYAQFDSGPFPRGIFIPCAYSHNSHHTSHVPSRAFRFYVLIVFEEIERILSRLQNNLPSWKTISRGIRFSEIKSVGKFMRWYFLSSVFLRYLRDYGGKGERGEKYSPGTNSRINCVRDRQTVIPNRTKEKPRSQPKPPLHRQCKHLDIYSGERKRWKVLANVSDNPQTVDGIYMYQRKLFLEKENSKTWTN